MSYKNFFSDFISLEKQFFADNSMDVPSEISRMTFQKLKNFLFGFSWTKSENTRFIVMNMSLDSGSMVTRYNAQNFGQGKKKSSSTFRVQKAAVSKFLYSIFGEDYRDAFYSQDLDEHEMQDRRLRKIQVTIDLLSGDSDSKYQLNLPTSIDCGVVSTANYSLKDCEPEIMFLSRYTNLGIEKEISKLDSDKLSFLLGILHEGFFSDDVLNNKKLDLLNRMTLFIEGKVQAKKVEPIKKESAFEETTLTDDDLYGNVF